MTLRIICKCGKTVTGSSEDDLWNAAQAHFRDDHPDLVGKVDRDDILAQAEEV